MVMSGERTIYKCVTKVEGNYQIIELVDDINLAMELDSNYRIASFVDIDHAIRVGITFSGLVHIQEGVYQWNESNQDEDDFGYRLVS